MLIIENAVANRMRFRLLSCYVLFCRTYIIHYFEIKTDPVAVAGGRDFGSLHDVVRLYIQA
jgi:hypothetical protein